MHANYQAVEIRDHPILWIRCKYRGLEKGQIGNGPCIKLPELPQFLACEASRLAGS
jgi:hypothetical protein